MVALSRLVYRKGVDLLAAVIPAVCRRHPHVDFVIGAPPPGPSPQVPTSQLLPAWMVRRLLFVMHGGFLHLISAQAIIYAL